MNHYRENWDITAGQFRRMREYELPDIHVFDKFNIGRVIYDENNPYTFKVKVGELAWEDYFANWRNPCDKELLGDIFNETMRILS
jgi:hypothetical protein